MKCIIVEDQPPAQRILRKYIDDLGTLELMGTFTDPLQAMDFLRTQSVELIFLDIHLPKLSGIDFLKTLDNPPHIILTTAFADFALESYELNVVDYLLKPFSFARFIKAVSKINHHVSLNNKPQSNKTNSVYIKSGHNHHKVIINDIICINSDRDYTEIHTNSAKHLSKNSLKHWVDLFEGHNFVRVHKSYMVNEEKITKITATEVVLVNEFKIPIGRAFKQNLERVIK